jgi:ATP-dependent Clp protease ATP-binding subunit ClpC
LVNRVVDIIVFRQLTREDVARILELELAKLRQRVDVRNIQIDLDEPAAEFLVEKGFDEKFGARPLRRAVEKYLQDPLAEEILAGRITDAAQVRVVCEGDKLAFQVSAAAPAKPAAKRSPRARPRKKKSAET